MNTLAQTVTFLQARFDENAAAEEGGYGVIEWMLILGTLVIAVGIIMGVVITKAETAASSITIPS